MAYPAALHRLVAELERLPGIGPRTAERLAFHLVRVGPESARQLARAIEEAVERLGPCSVCFHLSDQDPCALCSDEQRDRSRILVVEQPRDLEAMEKAGWRGLYHVLHGGVSHQDGSRPGSVVEKNLVALGKRARDTGVDEVVLGTNPDLEGDGTAMVVRRFLAKFAPKATVRRLARGMPTGGAIEYTNPAVLAEAIQERREFLDAEDAPSDAPTSRLVEGGGAS